MITIYKTYAFRRDPHTKITLFMERIVQGPKCIMSLDHWGITRYHNNIGHYISDSTQSNYDLVLFEKLEKG